MFIVVLSFKTSHKVIVAEFLKLATLPSEPIFQQSCVCGMLGRKEEAMCAV